MNVPEPRPATAIVCSLLKRLREKGFVNYRACRNSRQHYGLVSRTDYFATHLKMRFKNFFNDSSSQFASVFTRETDLSDQELEDLKKIVEKSNG